jgi:hypothetical protein
MRAVWGQRNPPCTSVVLDAHACAAQHGAKVLFQGLCDALQGLAARLHRAEEVERMCAMLSLEEVRRRRYRWRGVETVERGELATPCGRTFVQCVHGGEAERGREASCADVRLCGAASLSCKSY